MEAIGLLPEFTAATVAEYGRFDISSIPPVSLLAKFAAVRHDRARLESARAVLVPVPELAVFVGELDEALTRIATVKRLLAHLGEHPGVRQAGLGRALGEDGRVLANLLLYLEQDRQVVRIRVEKTYELYLAGNEPTPLTAPAPFTISEAPSSRSTDTRVSGRGVGGLGPLGEWGVAIVDLETTGLSPTTGHRIIEVGVLVVDDGGVQDEYVTLVNPQRHIAATEIHGLSAGDLVHAPTFAEICPELICRLRGRVVVAHNAAFDLRFLDAELDQAELDVPPWAAVCTLAASRALLTGKNGYSLAALGRELDIPHEHAHSALGDARTTLAILTVLLQRAQEQRWELENWGCTHAPAPPESWPPATSVGRCVTRSTAASARIEERRYLAELVLRAAPSANVPDNLVPYLTVLDEALLDRVITADEIADLEALAADFGLGQTALQHAHRQYLDALIDTALADNVITKTEQRDLEDVAELLDLADELDLTIAEQVHDDTRESNAPHTDSLAGLSVCFTGELAATINGEPITRTQAHRLATTAGLEVRPSITRSLDLLVVADPNTQSGKAIKAHRYGIRILAEPVFWAAIGTQTD